MTTTTEGGATAVDGQSGRRLLVQVAALCAAVAFLDGIDLSSINIAAPRIADYLRLSHAQLGPVFSAGLLGATIGALSFGVLADRYGRKRLLLVATTTFGLFTLLTVFIDSYGMLLLLRLLTGIGLGGATPCFIALSSEYTPKTQQARVTGLVWTAFPLGTVLGTFMSAYLVATHGWPSIFLVGGVVPLLVTVALMIWLPESAQFLLMKKAGALARRQGVASPIRDGGPAATPMATLFSGDRRTETLLLWFAFAAVFGSTVTVFSWTTTIMRDNGIPVGRGAIALGIGGIGSLIGSASAGFLMERFSPNRLLALTSAVGALAAGCIGFAAVSLPIATFDLLLTGFFLAGIGTSGLLALAAITYPTAMRSTGVGGAAGLGRFGQVVMPLVPSVMLLAGFGFKIIFMVVGCVMLLGASAIFLLSGSGPVPRSRIVGAGVGDPDGPPGDAVAGNPNRS